MEEIFGDTTKISDDKNSQTMNTLKQPNKRSKNNNKNSSTISQVPKSTQYER
jgi:hypothetical protein